MDKPDFFKMAIDRNLYLAAPEAAEMCEHVWNTHVVPLGQKISDLMIENTRVVEGDRYRQDYFKRVTSGLESENKALREENTRLTTKFIEEEHAADHPNESLSYWQYQQFTRAAITKLKEEIESLKDQILEQGELDGN